MKCPICANEMENGFIQAANMITWVKKKHHLSVLPKEGEVKLGQDIINGVCISADICKKCNKVIVDYSNSNYKEV